MPLMLDHEDNAKLRSKYLALEVFSLDLIIGKIR